MGGIKIVRRGKSILNARQDDVILDSELETLPIFFQGEFEITVVPTFQDYGFSKVRVVHNLGYEPLAQGWIDIPVSGVIRRTKMTYFSTDDQFTYEVLSDTESTWITATAGVISPLGSSFKRKGFLYIFEKDIRTL